MITVVKVKAKQATGSLRPKMTRVCFSVACLHAYFSCFLRALNLFQAKALSDGTNVLLGNAWHYTEYDHNVVLWFNRVRAVAMHYIK